MPFKSKARDTEWHRNYMRDKRAGIVRPKSKIIPIPGLIMEGNRIVGIEKPSTVPQSTSLPIYNPFTRYKPGTHVLVKQGSQMVEMPVPELDAEGNIIY